MNPPPAADDPLHFVASRADACFTWDYERSREALGKLYDKAKVAQWNAATDIDWSIDVDPWKIARDPQNLLNVLLAEERYTAPFDKLTDSEWYDLAAGQQAWVVSQFLHGEQGALICTAQIAQSVPWVDAKLYAASQVADEARHVEAYARYLDTKMPFTFPVNPYLRGLLDFVVTEPRWDMTYLGMQIMIEGLALAFFAFQHRTTSDPLLRQITKLVMADEARHVAFGVISLREAYADLTLPEIRERQEFCLEMAVGLQARILGYDLWEWAGLPGRECAEVMANSRAERMFQKVLFAKIVPNLKKLGLLDAGDGWLRQRFGELGVLQYEDGEDSVTEQERLAREVAGACQRSR